MQAQLVNVLTALFPIFFTFALGFVIGKLVTERTVHRASYLLVPVVYGILWVIGVQSGEAISNLSQGIAALKQAFIYSGLTSVAAFAALWGFNRKQAKGIRKGSWKALWQPFKECFIAFGLVGLGVYCHRFGWQDTALGEPLLSIRYWLYALLLLIGMELAKITISRAWVSPRVLAIPAIVIATSLAAGAAISLITGEKLTVSLALSSGFGWFSLSGALAGEYLGDAYASVALLTDLFRELLGLLLIFVLGNRFAISSIGVCGATATSTTLPFVRKACDYQFVPVAIISGLILSLLAPFLMMFFLSIS